MKYKDYLKSEDWRDCRKHKLKKCKKCFVCKAKKNLHIHHKKYKEEGNSILGKEERRHLVVLCKECHQILHNIVPRKFWIRQKLYNFARNYFNTKTLSRTRKESWGKAVKTLSKPKYWY